MAPTRSCAAWSGPASPREAIHGNKSQNQRERVLAAFRKGEVRTLVATDIAARGIDVDGISHVVNFDLPNVPETYVHRIGRTARAGAAGVAISLCDGEEAGVSARYREAYPHVHSGERPNAPIRPARARPPSMPRPRDRLQRPAQAAASGARQRSLRRRHGITGSREAKHRRRSLSVGFLQRHAPSRPAMPHQRRRVGPLIQRDPDVTKEELLEFEGLVTGDIARRALSRSARQRPCARRLHRRTE